MRYKLHLTKYRFVLPFYVFTISTINLFTSTSGFAGYIVANQMTLTSAQLQVVQISVEKILQTKHISLSDIKVSKSYDERGIDVVGNVDYIDSEGKKERTNFYIKLGENAGQPHAERGMVAIDPTSPVDINMLPE